MVALHQRDCSKATLLQSRAPAGRGGMGAAGRAEGVAARPQLGGQVLRSSDHVRTHSSYGTHFASVRPSTQFSTGVVQ